MNSLPNSLHQASYDKWLHRYSILVVIITSLLIFAGGLVTTLGAGLAVPDWPLSFGSLNPSGWWRMPMVREEHGHRLLGATVGLLTLILCIWILSKKSSKWLRNLGIIALIAVIIQGILGGLRVIDRNIYFAMVHACLAQGFFCILVTLAWGTSAPWQHELKNRKLKVTFDAILALAVCLSIYGQITLGAIMRHSGAGMAIPTFPLINGKLFPSQWNGQIAIHFFHRVGALVTFVLVLFLFYRAVRGFPKRPFFWAALTLIFTIIQIVLGGLTIWTGRGILPTTLHVVVGAFLLGSSLSCVLWLFRLQYHSASHEGLLTEIF